MRGPLAALAAAALAALAGAGGDGRAPSRAALLVRGRITLNLTLDASASAARPLGTRVEPIEILAGSTPPAGPIEIYRSLGGPLLPDSVLLAGRTGEEYVYGCVREADRWIAWAVVTADDVPRIREALGGDAGPEAFDEERLRGLFDPEAARPLPAEERPGEIAEGLDVPAALESLTQSAGVRFVYADASLHAGTRLPALGGGDLSLVMDAISSPLGLGWRRGGAGRIVLAPAPPDAGAPPAHRIARIGAGIEEFGLQGLETELLPAAPGDPWEAISWSPDGERLAAARVLGGVTVVERRFPGAGVPVALPQGFQPTLGALDWSPDGRRLLVSASDRPGRAALFWADPDGRRPPARVGDVEGIGVTALVSPRGDRIVVRAGYGPGFGPGQGGPPAAGHRIEVLDLGTGERRTVYPRPGGPPLAISGAFSVSPDGRRIAFSEGSLVPDSIRVIDADGTGLVRIPGGGEGACDPVFSPDGGRLAFRVWFAPPPDGRGVTPSGIRVVPVDGAGAGELIAPTTEHPWVSVPAWSPDGRRLWASRVSAGRPVEVASYDLETREWESRADVRSVRCAFWFPPGRYP